MSYTSKYAQSEMDKVTGRREEDPKLATKKSGGSGQATEKKDKTEAKNAKRNKKVSKRRANDIKKGKTKNLSKGSRTYRM